MTPYVVVYSQQASWIRHLGFSYRITEKKNRIHLNLGGLQDSPPGDCLMSYGDYWEGVEEGLCLGQFY